MAYARACFDKKITKNSNTNLLFAMINKGALTMSLFKDQKLDFVRIQSEQPIKPRGEALPPLTGQPGDEIGVEEGAGFVSQQVQVLFRFFEVLATRNRLLHVGIEGLDTDFKVQAGGREALHHFEYLGS